MNITVEPSTYAKSHPVQRLLNDTAYTRVLYTRCCFDIDRVAGLLLNTK